MSESKRVFISYKRDVEPDERIALNIFAWLSKQHSIFIDQAMIVGTKWAREIEGEINKSDFFICFISEHSIKSEKVVAEIETAFRLYKNNEKPIILPVRLNYTKPLTYPLSAYLNPINYILWKNDGDTESLIERLAIAISGRGILPTEPAEPKQSNADKAIDRIKSFLNLREYIKALQECEKALFSDSEDPYLNILTVIAILRGRGADKLHPDTVLKLEAYLRKAFIPKTHSTALAILGIIKYDYYEVHKLYDKGFSFQDIKRELKKHDPYSIDMNLVRRIYASEKALRSLDLV